jgi:hypothetical protein
MVLIFGTSPISTNVKWYLAGWIVARVLGIAKEGNWTTTDFAFDVLSLQALFLVPRAFSFLGLWQYYGQLLPSTSDTHGHSNL